MHLHTIKPWLRWLFFTMVLVVITVGSLVNVQSVSTFVLNGMDIISHFLAYMVLSFSWLFAFIRQDRNSKKLIASIVGVTFYGILIEFVQKYMTESRNFDILDIIANTVGVLFGYLLFYALKNKNL